MPDEITLDKEVFKALAGDTRVAVLKSLLERRKTQSELSKELSLAAPTIRDHVDILVKAGLVREMDDGHKWKYIELTVKGKSLLQPADKHILVLLGTSLVGIAASAWFAYSRFYSGFQSQFANVSPAVAQKSAEIASGAAAPSAPLAQDATNQVAARAAETAAQTIPALPLPELAVLIVCLLVFGVAVGMWIKQTY